MWDGHLQMVHPDRVMDAEELARMPAVEPVYGLTEGLYPRIRRQGGAGRAGAPAAICRNGSTTDLRRLRAPSFAAALGGAASTRATPADIDPAGPAATRLAYDELLANQLALLMMRAAHARRSPAAPSVGDGRLAQRILAALPFTLTGAQAQALAEIRADLARRSA